MEVKGKNPRIEGYLIRKEVALQEEEEAMCRHKTVPEYEENSSRCVVLPSVLYEEEKIPPTRKGSHYWTHETRGAHTMMPLRSLIMLADTLLERSR